MQEVRSLLEEVTERVFDRFERNTQKQKSSVWENSTVLDGEGTKRGSWKTAIVEELVSGKDSEVRGARVRVMTKGRPAQ